MTGGTERGRETALAAVMCRVGAGLYRAGLVAGRAGNISARLGPDRILVTARGTHKGRLQPADLVVVDLSTPDPADLALATTELAVHVHSYRAAPGVGAVVHAHPAALTAVGLRRLDLAARLPEVESAVGRIMTVGFLPSGSPELGEAVGAAVGDGAAVVILTGHGAVAVGTDLDEAVDRLELAELSAHAVLLAAGPA